MRKIIEPQMQLGEVSISEIQIDLNSRDQMPQLLLGLKHIYCTPESRKKLFEHLENNLSGRINMEKGRPGMNLWQIFVLAMVRLNNNYDYDQLQDIANNHKGLREMLGHGLIDADYRYALQTIKDNVSLLNPECLSNISKVVVEEGHKEAGIKDGDDLNGRADSSVVKSDVEYPTDITLLFTAISKIIILTTRECDKFGIFGWRKSKSILADLRRQLMNLQNMKRSTSKNDVKKAKRDCEIKAAHRAFITKCQSLQDKALESFFSFLETNEANIGVLLEIEVFRNHAIRQIDQIKRRVLKGETIPHWEKVFSLFEPYTDWISKGKAGISQELGLRVSIVTDQIGFILHHHVMEKQIDLDVAVLLIEETKERYPNLSSCSFDKGYYSPENKENLASILEDLYLPKKGKLSESDKEIEHSKEFKEARRKHSAVESSINALQHGGFDRCPDHGIKGFKRYVGMCIVARNIQILGVIIQKKELENIKKQEKAQRKAA